MTEGGSWPPGGADLSYYLGTVIIDSLEAENRQVEKLGEHGDESARKSDQLYEEAEWRLGFAIRDLAVGSRARWLNPRSRFTIFHLQSRQG